MNILTILRYLRARLSFVKFVGVSKPNNDSWGSNLYQQQFMGFKLSQSKYENILEFQTPRMIHWIQTFIMKFKPQEQIMEFKYSQNTNKLEKN